MTGEQGPGLLPQSNALAEAEVDSISHLLSLDPELYKGGERPRIIAALRAMRVKWEASEAAEANKPKARAASKIVGPQTLISEKKPEDLGL